MLDASSDTKSRTSTRDEGPLERVAPVMRTGPEKGERMSKTALVERIWEVSNGYDPYEFPLSDKEETMRAIEILLDNEPMALIDGLVDMLENLED